MRLKNLLILGCFALFASVVSFNGNAQQSGNTTADADTSKGGVEGLVAQAKYWENRSRFDLAREAWTKILGVDPDHPKALSGLALAEARNNRPAAAQVYLNRLREAHPDHPELRRLEAAIRQGSIDGEALAVPRGLARQGRYEDAIQSYDEIFDQRTPGGRLGLEYFQTMAGIPARWGEARKGIELLVKDYPEEPVYKLALAQHLTYREETRRQGISELEAISKIKEIEKPVRDAWRQALLWLDARSQDRRYFDAYLGRYGNEPQIAEISKKLRTSTVTVTPSGEVKIVAPDPRVEEVRQAFELLNGGDLDLAAIQFENLLAKNRLDADALGGLGIIRLRREQFDEAESLLRQAMDADPKKANRWREAYESAAFYGAIRRAEAARTSNQTERAELILRDAFNRYPDKVDHTVLSTLADTLRVQEKFADAEAVYKQALQLDPTYVPAVRGLMGILAQQQRVSEALQYAESLPRELRSQLDNLSPMKAQYLRDQAELAIKKDDLGNAELYLKEALLLDPENPWVRLSLGRIYQQQGRTREANTLIDGILTGNPRMGQALFIKALLLSEQERWYDALQLMENIPLTDRDSGMADLQQRLWVRYQTERVGVLTRYGQVQEALMILREVEPVIGDKPELLGAMATAYAAIGDEARALNYIRQALARTPNPDVGLRLQYAALLFTLRQDAEFEVVLEDLVRQGGFTSEQSVDLANLRVAYRLRQADMVREDGNLALAYDYLAPLLQVNPNDPRLLMALARLYNDAREYDRALGIYNRVLSSDTQNLDAYKGAVGAALALEDFETADLLLKDAFVLDPQNPRLFALAGRLARARGEEGRAMQLYRQALALDGEQGADEFGGAYAPQLYLLDPDSLYAPGPRRPDPELDYYSPAGLNGQYPQQETQQNSRYFPASEKRSIGQERDSGFIKLGGKRSAEKKTKLWTRESASENHKSDRYLIKVADNNAHQQVIPQIYGVTPETDNPKVKTPAQTRGFALKMSSSTNGETVTTQSAQPWEFQPNTGSSNDRIEPRGQTRADTRSDTYNNPFPPPRSVLKPTNEPRPVVSAPLPPQVFDLPAKTIFEPVKKSERVPSISLPQDRTRSSEKQQITLPPQRALPQRQSSTQRQIQYSNSVSQQQLIQPQEQPRIVQSAPISVPQVAPQQQYFQLGYPQQGYVQQQSQPVQTVTQTYSENTQRSVVSVPWDGVNSGQVPQSYTRTYQEFPQIQRRPLVTQQPVLPVASAPRMTRSISQTQQMRSSNTQRQFRNEVATPYPPQGNRGDPVLQRPVFAGGGEKPSRERMNLIREIEDIQAARSAYAGAGVAFRTRDGQSGLSRLLDIELPVEASFPGTQAGRFKVRATPVFLSAGAVSGTDVPLFGAMALVDDPETFRFAQDATGVAFGGIYELGSFRMDVGTSPLGFPVETLVGGIKWEPRAGDWRYRIDLSRRSVTDSLLSYAGTEDPATGRTWGGISRTGGRLDIAYDLNKYGAYVNGAYYALDGQNVDQNTQTEAGGGFYIRAVERRDFNVTYGVNATTFFYEKNRRRFTFGHGGYFSPQFYLSVGVPVEITGKRGRLSYQLNGSVGLQAFREDGAPVYPNDADLQAAINALALDDPTIIAGYPDNSSSGLGYSFTGNIEYLLSPSLSVGALMGIDNAQDFNETLLMGYVRYWFNPQSRVASPPNLLLPYYNFGNPQL